MRARLKSRVGPFLCYVAQGKEHGLARDNLFGSLAHPLTPTQRHRRLFGLMMLAMHHSGAELLPVNPLGICRHQSGVLLRTAWINRVHWPPVRRAQFDRVEGSARFPRRPGVLVNLAWVVGQKLQEPLLSPISPTFETGCDRSLCLELSSLDVATERIVTL